MAELHFNLFMRVTREGTDSSPISRVEENSRFQELGRKTLSQSANVYREREREKERERISKRREVSDGTDDDRRDDHSNGLEGKKALRRGQGYSPVHEGKWRRALADFVASDGRCTLEQARYVRDIRASGTRASYVNNPRSNFRTCCTMAGTPSRV